MFETEKSQKSEAVQVWGCRDYRLSWVVRLVGLASGWAVIGESALGSPEHEAA